jgi:hypothetical protein
MGNQISQRCLAAPRKERRNYCKRQISKGKLQIGRKAPEKIAFAYLNFSSGDASKP